MSKHGKGLGIVLIPLLLIAALPATASAGQAKSCGIVKEQRVRVVKGQVTRSECRGVALAAIDRFQREPSCGQWNTPDRACRARGWYCWVPTAGTQSRENLIAYCFIPKRSAKVNEQSWKPGTYKKLIAIGGTQPMMSTGECPADPRRMTQTIQHRRNITCRGVLRVVERFRANPPPGGVPECQGDEPIRWLGWELQARPRRSDPAIIRTRYAQGKRSFTLVGGGAC